VLQADWGLYIYRAVTAEGNYSCAIIPSPGKLRMHLVDFALIGRRQRRHLSPQTNQNLSYFRKMRADILKHLQHQSTFHPDKTDFTLIKPSDVNPT
jgi:hypothetical protein